MHYVIGDVHGCYDDLMKLLGIIEQKDADAQIIFVGDWIDRGPKVYETIEWMRTHITKNGKYQSVRGNHDQMAIDWYRERFLPWAKKNKRDDAFEAMTPPETYYDFSQVVKDSYQNNVTRLQPIINAFNALPYEKTLTLTSVGGVEVTYHIVHAWWKNSRKMTKEERQETNLWSRKHMFSQVGDLKDGIIVHGHTPTMDHEYRLRDPLGGGHPGKIGYRYGTINVDGGCCFFPYQPGELCMLCAICLETFEEFYPYTDEERFYMATKTRIEREKEMPYIKNALTQLSLEEVIQIELELILEHYPKCKENPDRKKMREWLGIKG